MRAAHLEVDGLEVVVANPQSIRVAVDGLLVGVAHRRPAALVQVFADLQQYVNRMGVRFELHS